ncbi:Gfo/Idh/MocA family oxidoreductase [Arthrobacter gengyunqii]|uniref:Gfo/Idh/MocA family oxidoreductase n=1 Tax=Arthrobacter gengyunqii TaxID=2886940 RepID=A0A9X1M3T3_9MICC|nr:Gfo/Idh/MocA family oxidoreductase [Arthrobacter gengyunqii]MCC3270888.1 Gfo/Idh/MocA family oxidoreductase [Arthrobacter gengyunqii]UOY96422.1 Gfo/Idh/MocA family oxidoreductase [Arthrobacter gengyunqii]
MHKVVDTQSMTGPAANADSLRVAVVGFGARASIAENVARARTGARVVAIVDPDPAGRDRARRVYPDATVYSELNSLIHESGIDAAIVTTPDNTHEEIAVGLLNAGIATYLEKPLAITLDGADRVLTTAAKTGTPLYVGHNFRHSGVVRAMRDIIDRGEIGEVKAVWVRHFVGNGGDYYYKDWHADRSKTGTLLLQKASHDIDVVHYLASGYTRRVVAMGDLMVYGNITDRRHRKGETMPDWFSYDNWPPAEQTGLNPVVDVEDISMMLMTLDNGVMASYQQCHFTPDYWRNYTVIGTLGRLENIGDTAGGVIKVWNRRHEWQVAGDLEYPIEGVTSGHEDADLLTMTEFFNSLVDGTPTLVSPLAAREAVAAGYLAVESLRNGSRPFDVPKLPAHVALQLSHSPSTPTDSQSTASIQTSQSTLGRTSS